MRRVIHLVPYDGVGGVETAARSMAECDVIDPIDFQVEYIYEPQQKWRNRFVPFNPITLIRKALGVREQQPDLLVLSLWRSCAVGIFVKMLRPKTRLVLFLHLPSDVHFADKLFTRAISLFAIQIWADSNQTLSKRLPGRNLTPTRVISFLTHQYPALTYSGIKPTFIFWGRIHSQKNLLLAIDIFNVIHKDEPDARFFVIGPDSGDLERIIRRVKQLGLSQAVQFLGSMEMSQIVNKAGDASFYFQTSNVEGMALSVVEAMQLGLVPVVTPVGEIAEYCRDGVNAIFVDSTDPNTVARRIKHVLKNPEQFMQMRHSAIESWKSKPLYCEEVLTACQAILEDHPA